MIIIGHEAPSAWSPAAELQISAGFGPWTDRWQLFSLRLGAAAWVEAWHYAMRQDGHRTLFRAVAWPTSLAPMLAVSDLSPLAERGAQVVAGSLDVLPVERARKHRASLTRQLVRENWHIRLDDLSRRVAALEVSCRTES